MQITPEFDVFSDLLGLMIPILIVGLMVYVYFAAMLMIIARKTNTPNAGLAWVPIVNLYLMCQIARKPGWWMVLLFIPLLNLIFFVLLWMAIAEVRGKPSWIGLLAIVPIVGLLVPGILAMGEGGAPVTPNYAASNPATNTNHCTRCGAGLDPGERFCGECGYTLDRMTPPPPSPARAKSSVGLVIAAVAVVLLLAGAWLAWRSFSYSAPTRQKPDLPQRAAGTITEFPVDNDPGTPARPESMVTQNFDPNANTKEAKVSEQWLPPGIDKKTLPQRAEAMTSAVYRAPNKSKQTTAQPRSPNAPSGDDVYVHVLNSAGNRAGQGEEIANSINRSTNGQRTGVRVNSPDGDTYTGSRIKTQQVTVYVLDKENSGIVIIVYAPTPATAEVADRLARNVGNGEGLNDYPEVRDSVWTLPPTTPSELVLQDVNTLTAAEMEGWLRQGENNSRELTEVLNQVRQFIPERLTNARYQDRARQDWNVVVGDYGSAMRAWSTWSLLRWTAGLAAMTSVSLQNGDGLYMEQGNEATLIFQRGPYLVLLSGPRTGSATRLLAFANQFQV